MFILVVVQVMDDVVLALAVTGVVLVGTIVVTVEVQPVLVLVTTH